MWYVISWRDTVILIQSKDGLVNHPSLIKKMYIMSLADQKITLLLKSDVYQWTNSPLTITFDKNWKLEFHDKTSFDKFWMILTLEITKNHD